MLRFKTSIETAPNGATVETATVIHEGREFTSGGAIVDKANGLIVGYVSSDGARLTTFEGETIAPIKLVRRWHQRGFYGVRVDVYAYSATVDGKRYTGRNAGNFGGPGCVITMRARG